LLSTNVHGNTLNKSEQEEQGLKIQARNQLTATCRWFDSIVQGCTGVAKAMDGRERPPLATILFVFP